MNDQQLLRYSRHILLEDFDVDGQQALLDKTVLIVGAGGLGCPAALYLAASGVGHLILLDDDVVELSNLQRQIAHTEQNIQQKKVQSLAQSLTAINSTIKIDAIEQRLSPDNADELISRVDLVLDCSDNFSARYLINQYCVKYKKPLVSGAAVRGEGQLAVFDLRQIDSPCYVCLYGEGASSNESCAFNGVLSPVLGVMGGWQAIEAIKLLSGYGQSPAGYLQAMDFKNNQIQKFKISKDAHCPICGQSHA